MGLKEYKTELVIVGILLIISLIFGITSLIFRMPGPCCLLFFVEIFFAIMIFVMAYFGVVMLPKKSFYDGSIHIDHKNKMNKLLSKIYIAVMVLILGIFILLLVLNQAGG